jgi:hypothetical protein
LGQRTADGIGIGGKLRRERRTLGKGAKRRARSSSELSVRNDCAGFVAFDQRRVARY